MSKRQKLFAGLLSSIFPGVGHIFLRRTQTGVAMSATFLVFIGTSGMLRIWTHYYGLIGCVWSAFLFVIVSACAACFQPSEEGKPSLAWLFLFLVLAFIPIQLMQAGWWLTGYRLYIVPSSSMQPTIWKGDRIVADSHYFRDHAVERGQILVFKKEGLFIVKRVEAIPGDVIEGKRGTIYLNGRELNEGFEKPTELATAEYLATFGPVKVAANEYFVLGDNRPISRDSRQPDYGNVPAGDIVGRVLYVFNPVEPTHYKRFLKDP